MLSLVNGMVNGIIPFTKLSIVWYVKWYHKFNGTFFHTAKTQSDYTKLL